MCLFWLSFRLPPSSSWVFTCQLFVLHNLPLQREKQLDSHCLSSFIQGLKRSIRRIQNTMLQTCKAWRGFPFPLTAACSPPRCPVAWPHKCCANRPRPRKRPPIQEDCLNTQPLRYTRQCTGRWKALGPNVVLYADHAIKKLTGPIRSDLPALTRLCQWGV